MAILSLRLCCVALALLLWAPESQCRNYTNEDIRDALISVVHLLRLSEDKLERHEFREKALGDHVKKMLNNLDKKHRALEPLKGMISRMDDRLSNVETVLLQKAEEEKSTRQKTNEALDNIQKSLQSLTTTVQGLKPSPSTEIENNLTTQDDTFDRRLDSTDAKIDGVMREIENLKAHWTTESVRSMCQNMIPREDSISVSDAEKLLTRFELKLLEFNGTKAPADIELNEVALADEAWHSKMAEEMQRQGKEITKVQRLLSDAEGMWKELPRMRDLQAAANATLEAAVNATLEAAVNATETARENGDKVVDKIALKLREMGDRLETTNKDIQQSLTQGNTLTERAFSDITRNYDSLRTELADLSKSEQVMLQTADNVIANKKRIEYGVQQIIMQVSDLVEREEKALNSSLNDRLDEIEGKVMGNQALTLVNLSAKIETEMSQVWRQIGIMHEQLSGSREALDALNKQSEKYVNSSTTTIGKVKENVDSISSRITTLDGNFNFALGKLDLVSQEFKEISSRINSALAKLKNAPADTHIDDSGPGPHKISSDERTD